MIAFRDEEKIAAFDMLAPCFAECNFGTVGKSEIELIFFAIVLQHQQKNDLPVDDYTLSNLLGITPSRVNNLRFKAHLRQLDTGYDWRVELAKLASSAHRENGYVTIRLEHPGVRNDIEHFIDQHGHFVDYAPNPKLLKMPENDFILLLVEAGMDKDPPLMQEHLLRLGIPCDNAAPQTRREKIAAFLKDKAYTTDWMSIALSIISIIQTGMLSK